MRKHLLVLVILLLVYLTGCAFPRHHPVVSGLIVGGAVGLGYGIATHVGKCPGIYDGHPYSGTPASGIPCPQYAKVKH